MTDPVISDDDLLIIGTTGADPGKAVIMYMARELRRLRADRAAIVEDYFGSLVAMARRSAYKASVKFPQPNYVTLKIAEEAGEVVRGAVHYAEGRMEWSEVEGEIIQLLAMLIRFVTEGDEVNGIKPPAALAPAPKVEGETPYVSTVEFERQSGVNMAIATEIEIGEAYARGMSDAVKPKDGSVVVIFSQREDGGLSVSSPTLPGLILSGPDPAKVSAAIPTAIKALDRLITGEPNNG